MCMWYTNSLEGNASENIFTYGSTVVSNKTAKRARWLHLVVLWSCFQSQTISVCANVPWRAQKVWCWCQCWCMRDKSAAARACAGSGSKELPPRLPLPKVSPQQLCFLQTNCRKKNNSFACQTEGWRPGSCSYEALASLKMFALKRMALQGSVWYLRAILLLRNQKAWTWLLCVWTLLLPNTSLHVPDRSCFSSKTGWVVTDLSWTWLPVVHKPGINLVCAGLQYQTCNLDNNRGLRNVLSWQQWRTVNK